MGDQAKDIKELIVDALKPLREDLSSLPDKNYIDNVVDRLMTQINERFQAQDDKIKQLEDRLEKLESQNFEERMEKLESELAVIDKLAERVDDAEQYSRRTCLRIYNMGLPARGEQEDCMKKVEKILEKMDCGVNIDAVDRAHRIGQREMDDNGKMQQQMIVKFKTFRDRTVVYRNRKDIKKVGDIKIRLDLTRKRLGVLREAKEFVKSHTDADFVFADINCSLVLKLKNGKFIFFNSLSNLEHKLA